MNDASVGWHCAAHAQNYPVALSDNRRRQLQLANVAIRVTRPAMLLDEDRYIRGESMQGVLDWLQYTKPEFRCPSFYIVDSHMEMDKVWATFHRALGDKKCNGLGTVISIGGVHWAAVYLSFEHRTVEYYDPYGGEPSGPVKDVLTELGIRVGAAVGSGARFALRVNRTMHQHDTVSCGLYSLAFLYDRIKRRSFDQCTIYRYWSDKTLDVYARIFFEGQDT